jgi:hypothetical protein
MDVSEERAAAWCHEYADQPLNFISVKNLNLYGKQIQSSSISTSLCAFVNVL